MALGATTGDLNDHFISNSSYRTANKFMSMQNSQAVPAHQKLATFKPSAFQKTPPMMGFSTPLRAGPAPRMELHEESVSEEKLPVVHTYGDADYSLRVVENYQDD